MTAVRPNKAALSLIVIDLKGAANSLLMLTATDKLCVVLLSVVAQSVFGFSCAKRQASDACRRLRWSVADGHR